ncbi:MAG: hypothetical protein ACHQQS_04185 [Thermoanaerobaculales bacterium]
MRFLLVDRVVSWERGGAINGLKCVAMSEDFLEYHFPGNPLMPGVLLLEAMVQLAGWSEAASSDFRRWFLLDRVRRCGFYGFAFPGDTVEFEVAPLGDIGSGRRAFRGVGSIGGSRRVAAEFEGELVDLAELEDPEAQRGAFARLTRERGF